MFNMVSDEKNMKYIRVLLGKPENCYLEAQRKGGMETF
jgi:hypothetical protein